MRKKSTATRKEASSLHRDSALPTHVDDRTYRPSACLGPGVHDSKCFMTPLFFGWAVVYDLFTVHAERSEYMMHMDEDDAW